MTAETTIPQGKAQRWTPERIAALILLLLSDVEAAGVFWFALAPKPFKNLLDAEPFDDVKKAKADGIVLPALWFDVATQRYGTGGKLIKQDAIHEAVNAFRDAASARASAMTANLYTGGIDIEEWQREMAATVKSSAVASVAVAVGGIGRIAADDLTRVSDGLAFHLNRLDRFARQIERGDVSQEQAETRAAMYPESIVVKNYDDARRNSHSAVDYKWEKNVLDPGADHCLPGKFTDGCFDLTSLGWVELGTLSLPGERTCLMHCRCHLEFAKELPD